MAESLLDRFVAIVTTVQRVVGNGVRLGATAFFILRVQARISRIRALLTQAAARAHLPLRKRPPCPRATSASPKRPRPAPPPLYPCDAWRSVRLPRDEGWLRRKVPGLLIHEIDYLKHLLAEPEMAALAGTPRVHRLLRPLCCLLGISDCLPKLAAPGDPVAIPTPAALAAKPPPPLPPATDPWAACAIPTHVMFPNPNFYRSL